VVVAGTALLCAVPAIVAAWPVSASAVSAAQLRAAVLASGRVPFQGYAESEIDLSLPSLPDLRNVISLLDGSTDQYVWYRSPAQWRADVLTAAGEDDLYQTGDGTYDWDYAQNLLTQVVGSQPVRLPRAADLLPPELARRLVQFAGPGERAERLPSERVAGISAAGLRLAETDPRSTIGAVDIWADPRTGLPVQVEIFGRGSATPTLVSRFLDLSFSRPPAAVVTPDPGPGVGQTTTSLPDVSGVLNGYGPPLPGHLRGFARVPVPGGLADVAAYGAGFARFAVVPLPGRDGLTVLNAASAAGATVQIAGGSAELLSVPLLTMLLVRSPAGPVYLLAGTVTPAALERAAASLVRDQ
jgi:hypothetical protein